MSMAKGRKLLRAPSPFRVAEAEGTRSGEVSSSEREERYISVIVIDWRELFDRIEMLNPSRIAKPFRRSWFRITEASCASFPESADSSAGWPVVLRPQLSSAERWQAHCLVLSRRLGVCRQARAAGTAGPNFHLLIASPSLPSRTLIRPKASILRLDGMGYQEAGVGVPKRSEFEPICDEHIQRRSSQRRDLQHSYCTQTAVAD
jgi:hypothetical protein